MYIYIIYITAIIIHFWGNGGKKNRRKPPARPSHLLGSGAGGSAVLRQLLGLLWGVMAVFFGNLMMNQCMYRCSSFLGKKKQKNMAWCGKNSKTCRKPSKTRVERWKKKLCQHREDLLDSRLKEETAPLVIDVYCWVPTARRYWELDPKSCPITKKSTSCWCWYASMFSCSFNHLNFPSFLGKFFHLHPPKTKLPLFSKRSPWIFKGDAGWDAPRVPPSQCPLWPTSPRIPWSWPRCSPGAPMGWIHIAPGENMYHSRYEKKCLCITIPLSLLLHNNIHNHIHNMYVCMYIYIFFVYVCNE